MLVTESGIVPAVTTAHYVDGVQTDIGAESADSVDLVTMGNSSTRFTNVPRTTDLSFANRLIGQSNHYFVGEAGAGGSGVPVLRSFDISYDDDLENGIELFTPAIGDILYDAWFEMDTLWNGTTPQLDFGTEALLATGDGFFYNIGYNFVELDNIADAAFGGVNSALLFNGNEPSAQSLQNAAGKVGKRFVPGKFISDDPIFVAVNTNVTGGFPGTSPGATQGSGILYIMTITPV